MNFKKLTTSVKRLFGDSLAWRITVYLPLAVPVMLAVFSVVVMVWLLLDLFYGWLVWPTATLAALGAAWWMYKKYPHEKQYSLEQKICTLLVLVGVLVWVGCNSLYTSQHIHVNRDPATYANTGFWLADHTSIRTKGQDTFKAVEGISGKNVSSGVFAQRPHLFSALIGMTGKVVSKVKALHLNPVFGGTALLAVYGFARLLMRPRWALLATSATAVTLPLIYFSRDTYTEPLVMTFTFGAMALLVLAWRTKYALFWLLAGLLAGAGQLARIDMMLSIIGLVLALFVGVAVAEKKDRRRIAVGACLFFVTLGLTLFMSMIDLLKLSPSYYTSHQMYIVLQLAVLAAVVVAGIVAVVVLWKAKLAGWLDRKTRRWRAMAAAIGVGVIGLVLASRPLWMVDRSNKNDNGLVRGLQEAAGLPLDGHQTYAEHTVNWLAWYMGWPLVILAALGVVLVAYRAMKHRDIVWIVGLAVILGTALAYFVKPAITPDQIWASRRLLPVVMPGIAIFAALFVGWLSLRKLPWKLPSKTIAACAATAMVVVPFMISSPFLETRTYSGQYGQTESVCKMTPKNAAVAWVGTAQLNMVQPTRAVCNIVSVGFKSDDSLSDQKLLSSLAKAAIADGYAPVVGVYGDQFGLVPEADRADFVETNAIDFVEYNHHLLKAPNGTITTSRSLLIAEIAKDGTLVAPSWLQKDK